MYRCIEFHLLNGIFCVCFSLMHCRKCWNSVGWECYHCLQSMQNAVVGFFCDHQSWPLRWLLTKFGPIEFQNLVLSSSYAFHGPPSHSTNNLGIWKQCPSPIGSLLLWPNEISNHMSLFNWNLSNCNESSDGLTDTSSSDPLLMDSNESLTAAFSGKCVPGMSCTPNGSQKWSANKYVQRITRLCAQYRVASMPSWYCTKLKIKWRLKSSSIWKWWVAIKIEPQFTSQLIPPLVSYGSFVKNMSQNFSLGTSSTRPRAASSFRNV